VQDAAAALPARLLGNIAGKRVADLCAAPGGKTAQLAAAGAHVTAVDLSTDRLARVRENLARLKLDAEVIAGDVTTWSPAAPFDAVLLDAPCTATGTIRRHPDILHLKRPTDLAPLVELQSRMLDRAATLVSPGGTLVYCTCSLEPEEGERQIERFLARTPQFERTPIVPGESGIDAAWITPVGDLRTLPFHIPGDAHAASGMDGFFAARLVRSS
jgi:16S rRNA (cytosine967-C5)-methyltransferase